MSNVTFVHIGSLAEMEQLESNFLSKVLNTACESKNQDNNSGKTGSSKSNSRKTSSSKAPNEKRPISSRRKVIPSKKKKKEAEDNDFQIEAGSPAEHSKPLACSQAAITNNPVAEDSEPHEAAAKDSEPSTSIIKHSEPPHKIVEDHAKFS